MKRQRWLTIVLLAAAAPCVARAQSHPRSPATPRIYVFDNGAIKGLDPALFNFKREELEAYTAPLIEKNANTLEIECQPEQGVMAEIARRFQPSVPVVAQQLVVGIGIRIRRRIEGADIDVAVLRIRRNALGIAHAMR